MKNLILLFGVVLLVSCSKDQYYPPNGGGNSTNCVDEYGNSVPCPDGMVLIDGVYWWPADGSTVAPSGIFANTASYTENGNQYVAACATYRQTYVSEYGDTDDLLVSTESVIYQLNPDNGQNWIEIMDGRIAAGTTISLIVDDYNYVVAYDEKCSWCGSPCDAGKNSTAYNAEEFK